MLSREQQILEWIKQNPMISQNELAELAGITRSGVAAHISNLVKKGFLQGKGYIVSPESYVAVVGGITLDIFGIPNSEVIEKKSNTGVIYSDVGGLGRNIAVNLTKLAIPNYFISVYGHDSAGEEFKKDALEKNLDITYSKQISSVPTSRYLYINQTSAKRIFGVDDSRIHDEITPEFLKERLNILNNAEMIVVDPNLPEETISWIYQNFDQPILADSINKLKRLKHGIAALDTLVLNADESKAITDIEITDYDTAKACADELLSMGISTVFIYDAQVGFFYQTSRDAFYYPVTLKKVLNTNGVGAAALAAIVYARRAKLDDKHTAELVKTAAEATMTTYLNILDDMSPSFLENHVEK
ncbi:PfkB family carbohydrate kinase [Levilactobacillus parabrevis]|uniref:PfkB family carbohydrate kinase n=1 Tax=Levilactobacillus parabrevis TaxID=357278 RepID=UPI0021A41E16|nr:PfkB family carbohydrate kinase [Levilactobacillus parabrevis]MCT4486432.1 winged helix-turn-helix transcriptional regulator [Levilactobacillus parabrevis]MCT4489974.1 winged helix-turn-helix transcriptional regulator [Levilactobacillus parabrevis]